MAAVSFRPMHAGSPLMLCDHLISLAQRADESGLHTTAQHLLALADDVLDHPPPPSFDLADDGALH